ncbi:DegV family protein [Mycoplasmopsis bovigenitalium]|uniref:DegV family protein n=1 Tax=Mycoplasmopsis bovigenitalium TaxID=2112 RepID=A0A449A8J5_9BACT|nr:DegV family protein [Mycoplasmopsis bovigenitalium]VEU60575.1 DegV family protein [Mycoplasmopsis bovigenitalium]
MKYAIVIDSSCGLTQEQAHKLGWHFLPLHINIEGKEFKDGVDITPENLFNFYNKNSKAKTSAVNLGYAEELFNKLSKDYDRIIVYPISKHLSASCASLTTLAKDFEKVRVVNSIQVLQMILIDLVWFEHQMSIDSSRLDEYIDILEKDNLWHRKSISLIPKFNSYLVKGGRLHPAAAAVAKLLKIVPIICWKDGQLLKEAVGRTFSKTVLKAIDLKKEILPIEKGKELYVMSLDSHSDIAERDDLLNNIFEKFGIHSIHGLIAPVVGIHTGPEALAILVYEMEPVVAQKCCEFFKNLGYISKQ